MSSYTPTTIANSNINLEQYTPKSVAETNMELATIGTELQLLSPASEVTGLTSTPTFKWEPFNPSSARWYQVRVVAKTNQGDTPDWSNEMSFLTTNTSYTVPSFNQLADGWYEWKVRPATLIEPNEFEDTFDRTTLGGDYTTETLSGSGSVTLDGADITIEGDASLETARQVLRLTQTFENATILLEDVVFSDVSTGFQPTIYFNTTGDFLANNQVNGYYLFFLGGEIRLGKVVNTPSDVQNRTFSRTVNVPYNIEISAINGVVETHIWESTGSKGDALHQYTDSNPYLSGGIDIASVVGGSVGLADIKIGRIFVTYEGVTTTDITGVTITGSTSDLVENQTREFTASVEGTGNVQQSVAWTATNGTLETISDNSATFTPSDTGASSVTATSTQDGSESDTINFDVVAQQQQTGDYLDSEAGDKQALSDLYSSTNGGSWDNNTGWSSNPNNIDLSGSIYGVQTEQIGGEWRVVSVKLNGNETIAVGSSSGAGVEGGNNLTGTLNDSLGNLKECTYFNVKQNEITGELSQGIFEMNGVVRLHLNGHEEDFTETTNYNNNKSGSTHPQTRKRSNDFSGSLPTTANLPNLEWFECMGTGADVPKEGNGSGNLTGPLPNWLANTNLKGISLSFNSISDWNTSIQNLDLYKFYFQGNALGNKGLPSWFSNFTNMRCIDIEGNRLGSSFPDLSSWTNITFFWTQRNDFTSNYPWYFLDGSVSGLNMFEFAWNDITDDVTGKTLGNTNLKAFTIDGNPVTGDLHESFVGSQARQVQNFGLGFTQLDSVPYDWSAMQRNRYIRFQGSPNIEVRGGGLPLFATTTRTKNWGSGDNLIFIGCSLNGTIKQEAIDAIVYNVENWGLDHIDIRGNDFTQQELQPLIDALAQTNISTFLY